MKIEHACHDLNESLPQYSGIHISKEIKILQNSFMSILKYATNLDLLGNIINLNKCHHD